MEEEKVSFNEEIEVLDKVTAKISKSRNLSKNFAIAVLAIGVLMFAVDSVRNGFTVAAIANAIIYVVFAVVGFLLLSAISYNQRYVLEVLEDVKRYLREGNMKRASKLLKMVEDSFVVKFGAASEDFEAFLKSFRRKQKMLGKQSK